MCGSVVVVIAEDFRSLEVGDEAFQPFDGGLVEGAHVVVDLEFCPVDIRGAKLRSGGVVVPDLVDEQLVGLGDGAVFLALILGEGAEIS
ncbi:MAG: hypothetical protein ABI600_03060 [Luteolibacter sp.]